MAYPVLFGHFKGSCVYFLAICNWWRHSTIKWEPWYLLLNWKLFSQWPCNFPEEILMGCEFSMIKIGQLSAMLEISNWLFPSSDHRVLIPLWARVPPCVTNDEYSWSLHKGYLWSLKQICSRLTSWWPNDLKGHSQWHTFHTSQENSKMRTWYTFSDCSSNLFQIIAWIEMTLYVKVNDNYFQCQLRVSQDACLV